MCYIQSNLTNPIIIYMYSLHDSYFTILFRSCHGLHRRSEECVLHATDLFSSWGNIPLCLIRVHVLTSLEKKNVYIKFKCISNLNSDSMWYYKYRVVVLQSVLCEDRRIIPNISTNYVLQPLLAYVK